MMVVDHLVRIKQELHQPIKQRIDSLLLFIIFLCSFCAFLFSSPLPYWVVLFLSQLLAGYGVVRLFTLALF
jgi:hypothetical protein